jgi:hypothetical protein
MVYNINVEFQITSSRTSNQTNKMVKTRNQNQKAQQAQQGKGSSEGMRTRSGLKLERVELPAVKLSKEMKRRANVKKAIAKKSCKKQTDKTDKKCNRFERLERDFLKHVYHNGGEMTAIWKNFEMAFHHIDKLCLFQKRVERNQIILM